jgi:hypothetical protein
MQIFEKAPIGFDFIPDEIQFNKLYQIGKFILKSSGGRDDEVNGVLYPTEKEYLANMQEALDNGVIIKVVVRWDFNTLNPMVSPEGKILEVSSKRYVYICHVCIDTDFGKAFLVHKIYAV